MSASISKKKGSVAMDLLKATAGYIRGATGQYISEVFPTTSSIIDESKSTYREIQTKLTGADTGLFQRIAKMKRNVSTKKILDWYLDKESEFDTDSDDENLTFDGQSNDENISAPKATLSPITKSTEKVAKTIVESSHKMAEANIAATANITAAIDKQTAIITSGFNKANSTLNSILDVITKNTSTLIELATATRADMKEEEYSRDIDHEKYMIGNGKFSLSSYKKIVANNFKGTELGLMTSMAPLVQMLFGLKGSFSGQDLIKSGIDELVGAFAPNLKENLKSIDSAVNQVLLSSLMRLGENKYKDGFIGFLSKVFGISAEKESVDTRRDALEMKSISFDTLTRESIVHTIPGYLREILKTIAGRDITYDPRSRTFKEGDHLEKEYSKQVQKTITGRIGEAHQGIQNKLNKNDMSAMLYDLLIAELGDNIGTGEARNIIGNFKDKQYAEDFVQNRLLRNAGKLSDKEKVAAKKFAASLGDATDGELAEEMFQQVARSNIDRGQRLKEVIDDFKKFDMDITNIYDKISEDNKKIVDYYKKDKPDEQSDVKHNEFSFFTGINYTNAALYEIYRRLNEGINVFQVGKKNYRRSKFEKFGDDYLAKPQGYKARSINDSTPSTELGEDYNGPGDKPEEKKEGEEDLTTEQRLAKWGKNKWGRLSKAVFNGSPAEVKAVFVDVLNDAKDVALDKLKEAGQKVNDTFGNVTGYLKHKLFGSAYSYQEKQEDGTYKTVFIKENDKGGLYGFVKDRLIGGFQTGKSYASKWLSEVKSYFNYGGDDDKDSDDSTKGNRKKFMLASIGAFIGSGILGGPIGMIMGSLGGLALKTTGLGDKLKKLLFGDKMTGSKGLVTKLTDSIFDPIRYEVGKTLKRFSTRLKKNILGPISDLGFAIRDRITSSIADVAKSRFGKVFKFIGNVIMSPFKGILGLAKFPLQLMGAVTRGVMGAGMGTADTTVSNLASIIATSEGRKTLSQRRQERNEKLKEEFDDEYKKGYKDWKRNKDSQRRNDTSPSLTEYMEESIDESKRAADYLEHIDKKASEEGSLYTHDQGLHNRIDEILDMFRGKFKRKGKTVGSSSSYAGNAVSAAAGITTADDGVVTNEESRLTREIIDESAKDNPSSQKLSTKLKALLGIQKNKRDEKEKKNESLFDKIMDFIGKDTFLKIAGGIAAILAFLKTDWKKVMDGIGTRVSQSVKDIVKKVATEKPDLPDPTKTENDVANLFMSPLDMKMHGPILYPQMSIDHTLTDAAGNDIHNIAATRAFNTPMYDVLRQKITNSTNIYRLDQEIRNRIRSGTESGLLGGYNPTRTHTLDLIRQRNELQNGGYGVSGKLLGYANKFSRGIAVGGVAGGLTGYGTYKGLQYLGVDEDVAAIGGQVANIGTQYQVTKSMMTGKGMAATAMEKLSQVISDLPSYLKKIPLAGKYISKGLESELVKNLKTMAKKLTIGLLEKAGTKVAQILAKAGINVAAGVATGGLVTAGFMIGGGTMQSMEAANLFQVREDDVDGTMRAIGAIVGALFNFPIVTLIDLLDIVSVPFTGLSIRQWLSKFLYEAIKGSAELSGKQATLNQDKDEYNQKFGTNLDTTTYNDMVNQTIFGDIWNGAVQRDENGKVQYNDDGSVKHGFGLGKGPVGGFLATMFGDVKKDENGKTIYDENGVPETNGIDTQKLLTNGFLLMNPATWPIAIGRTSIEYFNDYFSSDQTPWAKEGKDLKTYMVDVASDIAMTPFKGIIAVGTGIKDWYEKDSPWAKAGQKPAYWAGTKIGDLLFDAFEFFADTKEGIEKWYNEDSPWAKAGKTLIEYSADQILYIYNTPGRIMKELIKGGIDWYRNDSPWAQEGKTLPEYAAAKISEIPSRVDKFFTDTKDSIVNWYENDSPWGKNSQTLSEWVVDGFKYPFVKLNEFGEEVVNSVSNWYTKESPWGQEGKSPSQWAVDNVASFFGDLSKKVKEFAESLRNIKLSDLIKKGISSVGDYISNGGAGTVAAGVYQAGTGIYDQLKKRWDERNAKKAAGQGGGDTDSEEQVASNWTQKLDKVFQSGVNKGRKMEESQPTASPTASGGNRPAPLSSEYTISSDWGWRIHPITGKRKWHTGVDLAPEDDNASVISMFPGKVIEKFTDASGENDGSNGGWGNSVVLDIGNGFTNRYAHMLEGSVSSGFQEGDTIPAGTILGTVGSTGNSTGTHLHLQFNEEGAVNEDEKSDVDPNPYLNGAAIVPGTNAHGFGSKQQAGGEKKKKPKGPLAQFMDRIKEFGISLLDGVTGGLASMVLGNDNTDDSGSGSGATMTSGIGATTMSGKAGADVANKISQKTGIPAEWIWAQMMHETGRFDPDNPLVIDDHNYAGIKAYGDAKQSATHAPASEGGTPYRHFDSDDEYAEYQATNLRAYASDGIFNAKTPDEFVEALHRGGYFGGDLEEYKSSVRALVKEAQESGVVQGKGGIGGGEDLPGKMLQKFGLKLSHDKRKLKHIGGPDNVSPLPVEYAVSSPFGPRGSGYHRGIDLVTGDGLPEDSDILSTVHGKVVFADGSNAEGDQEANGKFGNLVQIDDGQWLYSFAHLKQGSVPEGLLNKEVNPGDKIGEMGNTGHSLGQHLHYQINPSGDESPESAVDPAPFLEGSPTVAGKMASGTSMGSITGTAAGGKAGKPLGAFAQFINSVKSFGNEYLSKITGGLVGDTGESASISATQGNGSSATFTGLSGNDNAQKAFNFFTKKGLSPAAAAGIIGNFMQESGCDPSKHQDGGPARGIAQWEGGRLDALYAFAEANGKPWDDLETQLEFLWSELISEDINSRFKGSTPETWTPTGYSPLPDGFNEFKSINDYKHATAAFEAAFERAGKPMMENRFAAAEEAYNLWGNSNAGLSPKTGGGKELPRHKRKNIGGPTTTFRSKNMTPSYDVERDDISIHRDTRNNPLSSNSTDDLLRQVLQELREINGNTGSSSELLGSLNEKEFVDHGVRNSIKALGKSARPNYQKPNSYNSTRSIRNLVRP